MILGLVIAAAQVPATEGNVQHLRLSPDALRMLWTDDATRAPEGYSTLRTAMSYTHRPLVWEPTDGTARSVVGSALQLNLLGSTTLGRFRFAVDLPLHVITTSDVIEGGGTGLGDMALDVKSTVLDPHRSPVGIAVAARIGLPTATVKVPLGGNGLGWEIDAIVDRDIGPVLLALNLGTRGGRDTVLGSQRVGDQFVWRLGAGWSIDERFGISADTAGRATYSGGGGVSTEGMLGGWAWLSDVVVARAGVGTGFGQAIGTPRARALLLVGYEPERNPDADEDGLTDRVDLCPSRPEDPDGFEDADGCPDLDDDGDGIFDTVDACKDAPEDVDGYRDDDGCPDPWTRLGVRLQDENGATVTGATAELRCANLTKILGPDQAVEVMPGSCTVRATAEGYKEASTSFEVPEGAPMETILTLVPEVTTATVHIRVTDTKGKPIERAAVAFDDGPFARIHDGEAIAAIPPGKHQVQVSAKGHEPAEMQIDVRAGDEKMLEFELEPQQVVVTLERIELNDKVHFETGSSQLKSVSFALLDEVAAVLLERTDILKVRIEGHTDARGSLASNQRLSEDRAEAVRAYLIGKGVDPERLIAVGYGETRPLDPRRNPKAYATNRRVEFHVEEWSEETR